MFKPIDLTNPDILFDIIISHQRRLEALETSGTQPPASNTGSPPCSCNSCPAHLCICQFPFIGSKCREFWVNMAQRAST